MLTSRQHKPNERTAGHLRGILLAGLLIASVLLLSGCLGPNPTVTNYQVVYPTGTKPLTVDATIKNIGPGDGSIEVVVNVTNKQNGETVDQDSKEVSLAKDETQHVYFRITLPPSAQSLTQDQLNVEVEAHYPIE